MDIIKGLGTDKFQQKILSKFRMLEPHFEFGPAGRLGLTGWLGDGAVAWAGAGGCGLDLDANNLARFVWAKLWSKTFRESIGPCNLNSTPYILNPFGVCEP